jgi:hypothetical protein
MLSCQLVFYYRCSTVENKYFFRIQILIDFILVSNHFAGGLNLLVEFNIKITLQVILSSCWEAECKKLGHCDSGTSWANYV